LSDGGRFNSVARHSVMAMITSAAYSAWPLDVLIADLASAGLPQPSRVRFKLFTLDDRLVRGVAGSLAELDKRAVLTSLGLLFG
jgi:mRNA interferase MazF